MKKNMGTADRVIRTVIAVAIGVLYFTGRISGTLAIILGIVALVFLATSLIGWCPAYVPLGLKTCREPSGSPGQ
jgi:K+-transporting ATPase A subunit